MSDPDALTLLLVEDDPDDIFMIRHAFGKVAPEVKLVVARDGEEAVQRLSSQDRANVPVPDLVLLDLKLPRKNGFEVLEWIRRQPAFRNVPVVIHSSSQEKGDLEKAYRLGANTYLAKKVSLKDLVEAARGIVAYARAARKTGASRPETPRASPSMG